MTIGVVKMNYLKNQRGQALVEFAIILPILLLLVMGIFQFGMMINSYLTIQNITREGARAASIGWVDSEIIHRMEAISPTLDHNQLSIDITPSQGVRRSGESLTVKASYQYSMTVPIISNLFDEITLNAETSMRVE